jgi:hypothetical protein
LLADLGRVEVQNSACVALKTYRNTHLTLKPIGHRLAVDLAPVGHRDPGLGSSLKQCCDKRTCLNCIPPHL